MPWHSRFAALAIASGLLLVSPAALLAQEFVSAESYTARLETLEAELAALRASVSNSGGGGEGSCCNPDIDACRIVSSRCPGWIGGFDVYAARPHSSMGIRGGSNADLHFDYEATPRIWVGYQGANGLGLRMRYWEFDQIEFGSTAIGSDSIAYDTFVIDLEAIDTMQINTDWVVTLAAGLRFVDFTETRLAVDAAGTPITGHSFDGDSFGATVGAEVRRPLWNCLMGYASARGSVLFGDQSEFAITPAGPVLIDFETDNVFSITELALGVDWTRQTSRGSEFFVRAGYEVQFWDNFTGEPAFDGGESIGFEGFVLGAGIRR